jgi:hypothetical protein
MRKGEMWGGSTPERLRYAALLQHRELPAENQQNRTNSVGLNPGGPASVEAVTNRRV